MADPPTPPTSTIQNNGQNTMTERALIAELLRALQLAANDIKHYGYGDQSVVMKAIAKAEKFLCDTPKTLKSPVLYAGIFDPKTGKTKTLVDNTETAFPTVKCTPCDQAMIWIEVNDNDARCFCDGCGQTFRITPEEKVDPREAWEQTQSKVHTFESQTTGEKMTVTFNSAFDKQEGGAHYKDMKSQPFAFVRDNNVGHAEGEAIYRLLRWREKGGIADLRKVIHTIELIIEYEEGRTT